MRFVLKAVMAVVLIVAGFTVGWVTGQSGLGQEVDPASLSERERAFADRMENVTLVGHFTIDGREDLGGRPERYEIERVVKVGEDRWRFDTHMVYGSTDVTLPVTVPIAWAGDTPMVSITSFAIPTLGTFTARVMFYDDRYAGSWEHEEVGAGGLMYGTIER